MLECPICEGNGVIVLETYTDGYRMVELCFHCDGEGEVFWVKDSITQVEIGPTRK